MMSPKRILLLKHAHDTVEEITSKLQNVKSAQTINEFNELLDGLKKEIDSHKVH